VSRLAIDEQFAAPSMWRRLDPFLAASYARTHAPDESSSLILSAAPSAVARRSARGGMALRYLLVSETTTYQIT
jgi:hypothetical protein